MEGGYQIYEVHGIFTVENDGDLITLIDKNDLSNKPLYLKLHLRKKVVIDGDYEFYPFTVNGYMLLLPIDATIGPVAHTIGIKGWYGWNGIFGVLIQEEVDTDKYLVVYNEGLQL